MNVTAQWRDRGRDLRGEYWRCPSCQALSAVRRLACAQCGSKDTESRSALPAKLRAAGWSHSHLIVETLDQTGPRAPVMLMELADGRMFPMLLAESDAAHAAALVGAELDLVLRRVGANGPKDPIRYGRKVAADAVTRSRRLKKSENPKQDISDE
jgi:hypothetical protein